MELYIALEKNNVKGIFNKENLISKKDNYYIVKYTLNSKGIVNQNDTVYIFFQYVNDDFKNLKIFSDINEAYQHRDNKYSYGHIVGLKQDKIYDNFYNYEFFSIKELN